jgi:hypothetical protein
MKNYYLRILERSIMADKSLFTKRSFDIMEEYIGVWLIDLLSDKAYSDVPWAPRLIVQIKDKFGLI